MRRLLLAACAIAALAVAGCGGDDDDGGSTAPSTAGAAASGGGLEIKMKDIKFDPADTTVKVGQEVTWVNEDTVDHDVKASSGADFASDTFGKDGTFSFTPDKAGTIEYVCTLHPGMTAKLNVTG